jgi:hypothetical protein
MLETPGKTVSIATSHHASNLSKGQKFFNNLIRQIEKKRAQLVAWESAVPRYQQKYVSEWIPLIDTLVELRIKLVCCLDDVFGQKGLTKTERRKVADLIIELAGELVAARNDPEMKATYNQYSRSDYDSKEAADLKGMKFALEDVLGVELGEDLDLSSPDDILARAQAKMHELQTQYDADQQARKERRAKRTPSAKQLAHEARQQTEKRQLSHSIRELYRKLASALHPDRETDPQERDRKTALMQRANQAYDKNNLLQLLELQLELEHIDQSAINNISEDRLKHYNKILEDQFAELEQEVMHVEAGFRAQFGISPFVTVTPGTILRDLASDIVGLQLAIRDLKRDLHVFDDTKKFKTWLKGMRRRSRMDGFDDFCF